MDISLITIGIVKTALLTAIAIVCLRVLAIKMLLVDRPSELKKHSGDIPLIGGIVIFSVLWSLFYFEHTFSTLTLWLFIGSLLITTLGGLDDLLNLGVKKKTFFHGHSLCNDTDNDRPKITTLGDIFFGFFPGF